MKGRAGAVAGSVIGATSGLLPKNLEPAQQGSDANSITLSGRLPLIPSKKSNSPRYIKQRSSVVRR